MLSFIRRALGSWVVLLLLGLLVVAFVITGIGDPMGGGGVAAGSVAKVGDENITEAEFAQDFDRFMRRARETNPALTNAEAAQQGAVEQVLDQMIRSAALEQFGREQRVSISQRAVDGQIASIPAFQSGGKFDEPTFRRLLQQQRITERELRDGLTGDAIRGQLLQNLSIGATVPRTLVEPYAALLLETRTGSIGTVLANADVGAPTPAQLEAFYKTNIKAYTLPERRGFRYALLTQDGAMASVVTTDADIKRYYDENQETYGGIEQRQLSQVVVPTQDAAAKIAARVKAGEPFATVASALAGYSAADLDVGQVTQKRFADATSPAVAAAAFGAAANGVAGPIKSDFGWHVVQVRQIVASPKRALEAVRADIVAKLRADHAPDALSDAVAAAQDAFEEGKSFADVARERKLTVAQVPPVTATGAAPGTDYRFDTKLAPVLKAAFDPENAGQPSVQEIDKTTFALLDVGDTVAATPVPLAQIGPQVAANWAAVERMKRAKAAADAIVADVAKGKTLAAAMAERRLPAPQSASIRRLDVGQQGKVTPPIAALFTLPERGVRAIPGPNGAGWLIVRVDKVTPGDPALAPQIAQATRAQIANAMPDELARQFTNAVEREVGVKRDAKAIARLRTRYLGGSGAAAQ